MITSKENVDKVQVYIPDKTYTTESTASTQKDATQVVRTYKKSKKFRWFRIKTFIKFMVDYLDISIDIKITNHSCVTLCLKNLPLDNRSKLQRTLNYPKERFFVFPNLL